MSSVLRCDRIGVALVVLLAIAAESSAQGPRNGRVIPPPTTPEMRYRSLGREFVEKLRYPFAAIPEAFRPDPPPRVVMRPRVDGTMESVTVGPEPIKPLFLSGYAGRSRPAPRAPLTPTGRRLPWSSTHVHGDLGHPER